jgi:SAM-dependent methyltransferase
MLPGFEGSPAMRPELEQWLTPAWAAEALLMRHYSHLTPQDLVLEPGCGTGRWLRVLAALKPDVPAVGVEIDPRLALVARSHGILVHIGDFLRMELAVRPTLCLGNWPFNAVPFWGFLDRCHQLLPDGGEAGVLTTSLAFKTTSVVLERNERWSIAVEMLPRDMFPRLRWPLVFVRFLKDRCRRLWGLALYDETAAALGLKPHYRRIADEHALTWRAVVLAALERLGGQATLSVLYAEVEAHRPSNTQWWREKVRQTLQLYALSVRTGEWALR